MCNQVIFVYKLRCYQVPHKSGATNSQDRLSNIRFKFLYLIGKIAIKYSSMSETGDEIDAELEDASPALHGSVDVSLFASGSTAHLKIADKGIGISPEVLPHVFDRFYRADMTRSRGAGGVGLGLAIVKAIVAAHDGTVSISSRLGEGSTVLIELPLYSGSDTASSEEPASAKKQSRYQAV